MICGNVRVEYSVPKNKQKCPSIKVVVFILTMDENGFITWPTDFDSATKARLRT